MLANGQPLPAGCPTGGEAGAHTVAFVAEGNAWVLDPDTGEATCLFAAPAPGPFTWNPRGDRALLNGLEIQSISGKQLRAESSATSPVSSWGHPIGKAVVYISDDGTRLLKIYPGTQHHDDITPVPDVHYLNVIYHPSGLALAFVIDTGERQEIWLSSNLGADPVRLVFAVEETTFGALGFTADGTTLLYGAVHRDDAPLLHALDLTDPTVNQGLWHGEAGDRISEIFPQPAEDGELVAMTVGAACEDSRAMLFHRGELATPLAEAPSRSGGLARRSDRAGRLRRLRGISLGPVGDRRHPGRDGAPGDGNRHRRRPHAAPRIRAPASPAHRGGGGGGRRLMIVGAAGRPPGLARIALTARRRCRSFPRSPPSRT